MIARGKSVLNSINRIKRGRIIVISFIVATLLINAIPILILIGLIGIEGPLARDAFIFIVSRIIELIATSIILIFFFKGKRWSKWLVPLVFLVKIPVVVCGVYFSELFYFLCPSDVFMLFLFVIVFFGDQIHILDSILIILSIAIGLTYSGVSITLMELKSVKEFMKFQRGEFGQDSNEFSEKEYTDGNNLAEYDFNTFAENNPKTDEN